MKQLYILHGWTYSLEKWTKVVDLLKKQGIKPILLEIPGLTGDSEKSWTIDEYVEWLHSQLPKGKNVTLLGHSNGGRIALNYALAYPQSIEQLILLDSAGVYHNGFKIRLKRAVFKSLARVGRVVKNVPMLRKVLYKLARETDYRDAPQHMRLTMAHMLESDKKLDVSSIEIKTTILWGDQDTVTPPADAKILAANIKHSRLQFIAGARHSPHDTHPAELSKKIIEAIL